VKLRQQVLKELDIYTATVSMELHARTPLVDSIALWEGTPVRYDSVKIPKASPLSDKELALADERARTFMPRGAIMRIDLDPEHWLSFGAGDKVPAILFSSDVFMSKDPVQTPARFSDAAHLRLSGLLWPEAKTRWATTAYATRESRGKGQVILFAGEPNFRATYFGTERLLLNALFLGPGFGTEHPVGW
jgi:hypothetical protein